MENVQKITRWAGHHRILIRFFVLPIAFYFFGRMAFVLGGEFYFWGYTIPEYTVYALTALMIAAAWFYPKNPRQVIYQLYWKIKGLEFTVCMASFFLWMYIGNQTVQYFNPLLETTSKTAESSIIHLTSLSSGSSENSTASSNETTVTSVKRSFFNYFKNSTHAIKMKSLFRPKSERMPTALGVILGAIGIAAGIVVLVCGIQCGGASGSVALGVIGGLALIGLGIWALVATFKPDASRQNK
ncbi:hypothetical protein [Runella sp.]|uniref:hypothetical protein n=1 Tax=Runella sp. TaxID=1960881 RepID=UPI003D0E9272